jgi:acetyl esterase
VARLTCAQRPGAPQNGSLAVLNFHPLLHQNMALDPQVAELLQRVARARHPDFSELSVADARLAYERAAKVLDIAPRALPRVDDFAIRGSERPIPVRVYVPRRTSELLPITLYLHGGGFTIGSLNTHDAVCRMLSADADCIVVSVDYRLAPEAPFPAAADDALSALAWVYGNARRLGADQRRMAVAGDSAGGTLAAVCAIEAARNRITLCLQLLIYPGVSAHQDSASHRRLTNGYLLDQKTIRWFFKHYIGDGPERLDWRFAPLDAQPALDLSGVARAAILVAGFDPLHDEGVAYAERLEAAGVAVELLDYQGMVHGFFNFGGALDVARVAHRDACLALRRAFGTIGVTSNSGTSGQG